MLPKFRSPLITGCSIAANGRWAVAAERRDWRRCSGATSVRGAMLLRHQEVCAQNDSVPARRQRVSKHRGVRPACTLPSGRPRRVRSVVELLAARESRRSTPSKLNAIMAAPPPPLPPSRRFAGGRHLRSDPLTRVGKDKPTEDSIYVQLK